MQSSPNRRPSQMSFLKDALVLVAAVTLVYGGAVVLLAALVFNGYGPFWAAVALALVIALTYGFGFREGAQRGQRRE